MSKRTVVPNRVAGEALRILAAQIRLARHEKGWTAADLGARIGVTARTITALEAAHPGTAIGTVLNAAAVTGVPLFAENRGDLAVLRRRGEEAVALIPSRTRNTPPSNWADDDALDF